jgi:signal transduction histidine kinase
VLDTASLVRHLEARVLEQRGLGSVARVALVNGAGPRERVGAFSYPYSFGAPFNSLSLRLSLGPLDDDNEPTWIALFACALALFMLAGLYALYRMVAVQLHFAERRENFVSAVSHELKTPLTAIRMYGELLRDDLVANDATRRDYYALITSESERLSRLVDNILRLAQIERAEPLRAIAARPGAIVRAALELLEPRAKELGFELCADITDPLPAVQLDGDSLTQIVFNLLDNAFKYARNASDRRIDVQCRARPSGVSLTVRDRGPGVADEDITRVLEPFFRSGSELVRRHEGVGLGLALVKGMVEQMHGSVECHNAQPGFEVRVLLRSP